MRPASDYSRDHIAKRKPLLLCFSHLRWSFVYQRPQHLLSRAARDYRVIFFEDAPLIADVATPRLDVSAGPGAVSVVVPVLPRGLTRAQSTAAQRALLDGLLTETGDPAVAWYYTPMAFAYSSHVEAAVSVYDCMDELSAFRGAPAGLRQLERLLFARSDLVFTGGFSLYEAKRAHHDRVFAFPSSIDKAHFAAARVPAMPDPADQSAIGRPRIGFFGVIDERMDIGLVRRAAELAPDWQFVMLGPVVKIDPSVLPRAPNIHWLGAKSYDELPRYLAGWDLGFMPFALNESTRFISPTKTPEYLAAGLPVLSTAIRDVVRAYADQGLVEIVASAEELVAKARSLVALDRRDWRGRVDRQLATTSWEKTWAQMNQLIRASLSEAPGPGRRKTKAASIQHLAEATHV